MVEVVEVVEEHQKDVSNDSVVSKDETKVENVGDKKPASPSVAETGTNDATSKLNPKHEVGSAAANEEVNGEQECVEGLEQLSTQEPQGPPTDDEIKAAKKASELKEKGNAEFKAQNYYEAINFYSEAIAESPEHPDYDYNKAVFFSNRAACMLHLNRAEDAVEDCTHSIGLSETYIKAYLRRAQAYEVLEEQEKSLEDVNKVLELDPTVRPAIVMQARLQKEIHEKQEKLKAEMMDKLKGIGNSILGKFGLSTDNFQMVQDPNSGGYNIKFDQNAGKPSQ